MEDDQDLLTVCFRCGSSQPLLRKDADKEVESCETCLHPFIRCMLNFNILPLIEFQPCESLSEKETLGLIQKVGDNEGDDSVFHDAINMTLTEADKGYSPVEVDGEVLESFGRAEVYAVREEQSGRLRYYKNMIPDIGIAICHSCCQFFHEEDFESQFLKEGGCPFCKSSTLENVSTEQSSKYRCRLNLHAIPIPCLIILKFLSTIVRACLDDEGITAPG